MDTLIPSPGELFDGVYLIEETLGVGGQGVVLKARDTKLERTVAIKLIRQDLVRDPEVRQRFEKEARAMARVRHPNVVEIYALREYNNAPYFVMEYIEGTTLWDYMTSRGGPPLAVDEVIGIIEQACRGVQAIHEAGAIHHDLKSTNVLIGPAFRVAITDLGLAQWLAVGDGEQPEFPGGTIGYISPEILRGDDLPRSFAPRADVYALGVLLFELMVGRLPYEGESERDIIRAQMKQDPPTPTDLRPELRVCFNAPLLSALARDPHARTGSAAQLREELLGARHEAKLPTAMQQRVVVLDPDVGLHARYEELMNEAFPLSDVACCRNGAEAVVAMTEELPDLVISDLRLPDTNGFEITAALKNDERTRDVPVIIVTGDGGAPDWRRLQSLGCDGFLVKPFDDDALISVARKLVPVGPS
jgi:serine/threonine-protein kinase